MSLGIVRVHHTTFVLASRVHALRLVLGFTSLSDLERDGRKSTRMQIWEMDIKAWMPQIEKFNVFRTTSIFTASTLTGSNKTILV
jgi:hypothetical protein